MRTTRNEILKSVAFSLFMAKQKDFLYIENNCAIFAPKRAIKGSRIVIQIQPDLQFRIGYINESCKNFELDNNYVFIDELDWIESIFDIIKECKKEMEI